jgi:hypothetical protein
MEKKTYYKYLFIVSAIWNWVAGILFIAAGLGEPVSLLQSLYVGLGNTILLVGIGFFFVSRDVKKNNAIALMGIIGKFIAFISVLIYFSLGVGDLTTVIAGTIDLIFALLFIEFLKGVKRLE